LLERRLGNTQCGTEQNSIEDRPEQRNRRDNTDDIGHPPWKEAVSSCRHEADRQSEESREHNQDCENRERNHADLEWMCRVDRLELHQLTDRILPCCCVPEGDECDDCATGRSGELGDAQEAAVGPHELHVGPKPTAEYADAVSGRERASRKHALRQKSPREQRRRLGSGKE